MKSPLRKPTGETTMSHVYSAPNGVIIDNVELNYPDTKEGVERYIIDMFFGIKGTMAFLPYSVESVVQNELDDFDFTVRTSNGARYLELMEIAPLEGIHGGHRNARSSYAPYDFSASIFEKSLNKSKRYAGSNTTPIDLLLYITHWAFFPDDSVLALLQYWFVNHKHNFSGVYLYTPIAENEGISSLVYPTPEEHWSSFDPERIRNSVVQIMNPRGWNVVEDS